MLVFVKKKTFKAVLNDSHFSNCLPFFSLLHDKVKLLLLAVLFQLMKDDKRLYYEKYRNDKLSSDILIAFTKLQDLGGKSKKKNFHSYPK